MICIDPGLRGVGVAKFDESNRSLSFAQYVKNPCERGRGYGAHHDLAIELREHGYTGGLLVIEHPRIYPGMPDKDLNDLLDVVAVGAACAVALRPWELQTVYPSEWKGTVKKSVMLERIRKALSPEELARCEFTNKSDDEDLLDAVGIGLWRLGRLNKKVYPR